MSTRLEELADLLKREEMIEASIHPRKLLVMSDADVLMLLRSFREIVQKRCKAERICDVDSKTDPDWNVADWERDVLEGRPYRTEDLPEFLT